MSKKKSHNTKGGGPKPKSKSYGTPRRSRNYQQYLPQRPAEATPTHMSLRDEARLTGTQQSFWTIDTKLRNRHVKFVSAGLHTTMEDEPPPLIQPRRASIEGNENESDSNSPIEPTQASTTNASAGPLQATPQNMTVNVVTGTGTGIETAAEVSSSDLFFIDTVGDSKAMPSIENLHIRSPSPAKSDSSEEEVLFTGRTMQPRVLNDPMPNEMAHQTTSSTQVQTVSTSSSNKPAWDDTDVEWVHRSKPGVGWSVPKSQKVKAADLPLLTPQIQQKELTEKESQIAAEDDYIRNVKEYFAESIELGTFANRELDVDLQHSDADQASDVPLPKTTMYNDDSGLSNDGARSHNAKLKKDRSIKHHNDDSEESDSTDGVLEEELGFSGSEKSYLSEDFEDEEDAFEDMDDERLALLLSKQEEIGLGSDSLLLFDDNIDATVSRAAKRYAKEAPKKSRSSAGTFPSASAMADILDQDPENAYDIMGLEPPSLRQRKGKGRATQPDFELSDEELYKSMQTAWARDRERKKNKKQEREELRAQGLLGMKNISSADNIQNYGEGMTIMQIASEFEAFLNSDKQELSLPPMDKRRRKMVHEIAVVFKINTKSVGSGNNRYTKLIRTSRTTEYVESRFTAKARKVNMGFFPRSDLPSNKTLKERRLARSGGIGSAVKYRDGEVVGGTAPEIGVENKGRAMLERMGWSSGMALGHGDNKGILQPVAHIVKNTKAGLG